MVFIRKESTKDLLWSIYHWYINKLNQQKLLMNLLMLKVLGLFVDNYIL